MTNRKTVIVGFAACWETFDPYNNEILNFIKETCAEHECEVIVSIIEPGIVISSCFGSIPK